MDSFWFEALRLKLRTEWVEPAHFHPGRWRKLAYAVPEVKEPERATPQYVGQLADWFCVL